MHRTAAPSSSILCGDVTSRLFGRFCDEATDKDSGDNAVLTPSENAVLRPSVRKSPDKFAVRIQDRTHYRGPFLAPTTTSVKERHVGTGWIEEDRRSTAIASKWSAIMTRRGSPRRRSRVRRHVSLARTTVRKKGREEKHWKPLELSRR